MKKIIKNLLFWLCIAIMFLILMCIIMIFFAKPVSKAFKLTTTTNQTSYTSGEEVVINSEAINRSFSIYLSEILVETISIEIVKDDGKAIGPSDNMKKKVVLPYNRLTKEYKFTYEEGYRYRIIVKCIVQAGNEKVTMINYLYIENGVVTS